MLNDGKKQKQKQNEEKNKYYLFIIWRDHSLSHILHDKAAVTERTADRKDINRVTLNR